MKVTKAINIIYRTLVAYIEDSAGAGSEEAKEIDKAYSLVNSKLSGTNVDYERDLAATSAYIYSELLDNPLFFSNIDEVMDMATKFIVKYPTGTNWEKTEFPWEETLYNFAKENNFREHR